MAGDPLDVFISYSRKDEALKDEVVRHLKILRREGKISTWQDRDIEAGTAWAEEIKAQLEKAQMILLLVTSNFLASDYCYETEMQRAVQRHHEGTARVIPIILKPCSWKHSNFNALQALPKDGKPVTRWEDREEAFFEIENGIRRVVDSFNAEQLYQKATEQRLREQGNPDRLRQELVSLLKVSPDSAETESSSSSFVESLGIGVSLEMVKIPGGHFWMGSLDSEEKTFNSEEKPLHHVTIKPFWMGKYAVTQAQWTQVAAYPQINIDLQPFPARFKGQNRPVIQVSWDQGLEFCQRLSRFTHHNYCLPSEAQWEYACRAGTMTPFHFGSTITPDLANCNGNYIHGSGPQKRYPEKTTDVGSFPPNVFGLYDMHGNVWEWCQDVWHENYIGAPTDGSAWMEGGDQKVRVIRGGSWIFDPFDCRSASRNWLEHDATENDLGFRVVLVSA